MPLHYHQETLDDADTIDIKPFKPYTAAGFIGRVEFV